MINEKLLSKFDRIEDLPVSEEMLGAYIEGNLSDSESIEVSSIIDTNSDLSFISFEVGADATDFDKWLHPLDEEFVALDLGLPEIDELDENSFHFPQHANEIDLASICEPQFVDDTFGLDHSESDVIQNMGKNNVLLHDSFDMESQSLDSDSNPGTDNDMLNENLDL